MESDKKKWKFIVDIEKKVKIYRRKVESGQKKWNLVKKNEIRVIERSGSTSKGRKVEIRVGERSRSTFVSGGSRIQLFDPWFSFFLARFHFFWPDSNFWSTFHFFWRISWKRGVSDDLLSRPPLTFHFFWPESNFSSKFHFFSSESTLFLSESTFFLSDWPDPTFLTRIDDFFVRLTS